MTRPTDTTEVALAPVRSELLARALADAERELSAAEAQAKTTVARAEEDARRVLDEARRQGAADGATAAALAAAQARRQARSTVLAAQRDAYEALIEQASERVRSLAGTADWPRLRARMATLARTELGDEAVVAESPTGVVAQAGSRRVELTLDGLAVRLVEQLAAEVGELWAP